MWTAAPIAAHEAPAARATESMASRGHVVTPFGPRCVFDVVGVETIAGRSGWVEGFASPSAFTS